MCGCCANRPLEPSTLQPARFEFVSGVADDEYVLDLVVVEP